MLPPHRYALTKRNGQFTIIRLTKEQGFDREIKRFPSLTAAIKAYKYGLKAYDDWKADSAKDQGAIEDAKAGEIKKNTPGYGTAKTRRYALKEAKRSEPLDDNDYIPKMDPPAAGTDDTYDGDDFSQGYYHDPFNPSIPF